MNEKMKYSQIAAFSLCVWAAQADAFTYVYGAKTIVKDNAVTFHVDIPGVSDSGTSWNDAFVKAANQWTMLSAVQVNTVKSFADPCANTDLLGGVGFDKDSCGRKWSEWSAAWASSTIISRRLIGTPDVSPRVISVTDIAFKSVDIYWDVYQGPTRTKDRLLGNGHYVREVIEDLTRVSAHEIGHALGLGHSIFPLSNMYKATKYVDNVILTADDICGVNIAHGNPGGCPLLLQNPVTVSGKSTTAHFVGGVSRDQGVTYDTVFQYYDVLDIMATVVVEDRHYNKPGRLHVVVEFSDGALLMKTDTGFSTWDGTVGALRTTAVQPLSGANEIYVLKDFSLNSNRVRNIGVSVYVGYSLDEEPGEVYYSGTPIKFRVQ